MNKITSTLTGLALVAAASVAPAFAQGNLFTPVGGAPFSITTSGSSFVASGIANYNPLGTTTSSTATFILSGTGTGPLFTVTSFGFTPAGGSFVPEPSGSLFTVVGLPTGATSVSSVGSLPDGTTFNFVTAPPAVPEASTVVSFGALLALGGMAIVLRRKGVKNAA